MHLVFPLKIKKIILKPEVLFFLCAAISIAIYISILFGDAELLASGDNYTYLQLGKKTFNFYIWDISIPLGGITSSAPNLLGFSLYSTLFNFLSTAVLQRSLFFCLYFFGLVGFYKLTRLFSRGFYIFALLPAAVLFLFNAFASLNPFSFFPMMYQAYLPLSLYYFITLSRSNSINFPCLLKLLVLAVIFTPINSNPALSITIFVPQALYLVLSIKKMNKTRVLNIISYYTIFTLINLWWLMPMLYYYAENASRVFSSGWFTALSAGSLYQNFRFIGQWGWYGKHFLYDYYPFHNWYDTPVVFIVSYALVIITTAFSFKKKTSSRKPQIFFITLFLLALFLAGGSRPPFGFVYSLLFDYLPGFKIFREPFTKFGELYVLSFSILFYISLVNIRGKIRGKWKFIVFTSVLFVVFINAKPILFGEHVWSKWNGSVRTSRVSIPTYWKDFEKYTQDNFKDARILATPKFYYGGAWNWIYGFTSADDVAVNFVDRGSSIIRNPIANGSSTGEVIDNVFRVADLPKNYLALLSVDYILQENDLDWRYSGELTLPPSRNDLAINRLGVEKIKEFGEFTTKYLSKIPNGETNTSLRQELNTELEGRPALILYKVPENDKLPRFYIPKDLVYSWSTVRELPYVLQASNYAKEVGVFIQDKDKLDEVLLEDSADRIIFGTRKFSRFSLEDLKWKEGWSWPVVVNTDPTSSLYKFVRIKESIDKALPRSPLDKADLLLWLAAKRVAEITKYTMSPQLEDELVKDYTHSVNQSIEVLKNVPENKWTDDDSERDYWGMIGKVLKYVERSNATLPLPGYTFDLTEDPRVLYKDLLIWVYEVASPVCGEYCYTFKVPEDGKYSVYIGDDGLVKQIPLDAKLANLEYTEIKNQKNVMADWHYDGITTFKKGTSYAVNLTLPKSRNLIDSGEWFVPDSAIFESFSADFVMQNIIPGYYVLGSDNIPRLEETKSSLVLWGDTIHYKPLNDFDPGKDYRVSFDYLADSGGMGVAIVESNSPTQNPISNSQMLSTKVLVRAEFGQSCSDKFGESDCWRSYKNVFRSSNNAKSALLYIYAYPNVREVSNVKVKNIVVEEVLEPLLMVKKEGNKLTNDSVIVPDLKFSKINPTKYKVTVSGATAPYDLIFSESYDSGWGIYLEGTKLISNSSHSVVNGYANLWHIKPEDTGNSESYTLLVEFYPQRTFMVCIILSFSVFLIAIMYCIVAYLIRLFTAVKINPRL